MDRPITLAEYSSWMQLISAEAAICLRTSVQLTERIEKIAAVREQLAHRAHSARQRRDKLAEETSELEKVRQQVWECLNERESTLGKVSAESEQMQRELAECERLSKEAAENSLSSDELVGQLRNEEAKLDALKKRMAESLTPENVWDLLPKVLSEDGFKEAIMSVADVTEEVDEMLLD